MSEREIKKEWFRVKEMFKWEVKSYLYVII